LRVMVPVACGCGREARGGRRRAQGGCGSRPTCRAVRRG
jgi:hypothetical protein